jgi:hypothetical protein
MSMNLGMHVMTPEPVSTEYFVNPSYKSVCLYLYPLIVARQWPDKNITATMNAHATIKQFLDVSYQ